MLGFWKAGTSATCVSPQNPNTRVWPIPDTVESDANRLAHIIEQTRCLYVQLRGAAAWLRRFVERTQCESEFALDDNVESIAEHCIA